MSFKNQDWTSVIQTIKLSKGITRSYKLEIVQSRWCWKDYRKSYTKINGSTLTHINNGVRSVSS